MRERALLSSTLAESSSSAMQWPKSFCSDSSAAYECASGAEPVTPDTFRVRVWMAARCAGIRLRTVINRRYIGRSNVKRSTGGEWDVGVSGASGGGGKGKGSSSESGSKSGISRRRAVASGDMTRPAYPLRVHDGCVPAPKPRTSRERPTAPMPSRELFLPHEGREKICRLEKSTPTTARKPERKKNARKSTPGTTSRSTPEKKVLASPRPHFVFC